MKFWITGKNGLVATYLIKECTSSAIPFIATGREVDISSKTEVENFLSTQQEISHIINCAAFTHVDLAEDLPGQAFQTNSEGVKHLGVFAKKGTLSLIHLSTDYVFAADSPLALFKEDASPNPINVYGQSKLAGEKGVQEIYPEVCIVRTSWVFGKNGKNFINTLLNKISQNEEVSVAIDQTNRLTFAKDLAQFLLKLAKLPTVPEGVYHFANEGVTNRFIVAKKIKELLGKTASILPVKSSHFQTKAPRPPCSCLSTEKTEALLKQKIRSWEEALEDFIQERFL